MVTRRTEVFQPLSQLRREMDRLFTDFFGDSGGQLLRGAWNGRAFPAVNVWERGDELILEAELPGLAAEDVDIAVVGAEVTLKGRRPQQEDAGVAYHRRERSAGEFTRSLRLPYDVNADQVQASLKDGVLTVTLPKAEAHKPKKISVTSAQ